MEMTQAGLLFGLILIGAMLIGAVIIGAVIITIVIYNIYHNNKDKFSKATKLWALIYSAIIGIIFIFPVNRFIRTALIIKENW